MTNDRHLLKLLLANPQAHALVQHLDKVTYPEATPRPGTELRLIDVEIGKREVVRFLLALMREDHESDNILGA